MYILTQTGPLENYKNNIIWVEDAEKEKQYLDAGYYRYERSYKLREQRKEYTLVCPEYRNGPKGLEPIVVLPECLIPGRPYPVYVYLYAIELYSSAPEKGQRWAAEETRKQFNLATFAHTTLGRALKAFIRVTGEITMEFRGHTAGTISGEKQHSFPKTQLTAVLRKQAAEFLRGIGGRKGAAAAYSKLAREWFLEYRCFLL